MKADLYLPHLAIDGYADQAQWASEIGYDGVFTAETSHDPFLPIAAAASQVRGLDYGTAIAVAFARSPMVVAHTAWDLSHATGSRFLLGLGTQVRAHVERRFSMPFSEPARRLEEYIESLRAIWKSWRTGGRLSFKGDFYSFGLMTPFFTPSDGVGEIPIYTAGVGRGLARLAGRACDGFHVHPFHTVDYLDRTVLPAINEGAVSAGRTLDDVSVASSVFVVTGRDDAEIASAREVVRHQIAFYASTPSYRPVLDAHGWDFGEELSAMSRRGRWSEMASLIPDEVLDTVAIVSPPDTIGTAIRDRYGTRLQRVGLYELDGVTPLTDDAITGAIEAIHA